MIAPQRVLAGLLMGFLAVAALAPALSAQEAGIPEGNWIGLFDGQTTFGWNQLGDAAWRVADGRLICDSGSGGWLATTSQFANFELEAKIRIKPGTSAGIAVRAGLEGSPTQNGTTTLVLSEPEGAEALWHEVRIIANGPEIKATVDNADAELLRGARSRGYIGVQYYHRGDQVEVSQIRLRPLGLTPIFNHKDLTGWNIIPERKSVFSVIDGALNIKDGNGQIETADVYKDFLLQLDICSNGDHLNSGVFFRGPVGVFWRGYESQVSNKWEGDDRNNPSDYGTGGIYGDQPARTVVPNDREWFHKTIICEGNHMAVWINGYQVSDFTDTRPIDPESNGKARICPRPRHHSPPRTRPDHGPCPSTTSISRLIRRNRGVLGKTAMRDCAMSLTIVSHNAYWFQGSPSLWGEERQEPHPGRLARPDPPLHAAEARRALPPGSALARGVREAPIRAWHGKGSTHKAASATLTAGAVLVRGPRCPFHRPHRDKGERRPRLRARLHPSKHPPRRGRLSISSVSTWPPTASRPERRGEPVRLAEINALFRSAPEPAVVAGDFNAKPDSAIYAFMRDRAFVDAAMCDGTPPPIPKAKRVDYAWVAGRCGPESIEHLGLPPDDLLIEGGRTAHPCQRSPLPWSSG